MTGAKRNSSRQPPWQGPDSEGVTFGSWLRQQREVRQIGLREVAESSKISLRYLQAFEQDHFEILPAAVFAKGFLRQYSAYVGLDADEVINHYLRALQESEPEPEEESAGSRKSDRSLLPLLALLAALIAIVAAVLWFSTERQKQKAQQEKVEPSEAFVPPPVPEIRELPADLPPPSPEPQLPEVPLRVTLEFTRDCWVDAVVDGGASRITQTYLPGEPLQIDAQESVLFRKLGNSGGVKVEINGLPFDLGGREGRVLSGVRIDLGTVAELQAAESKAAENPVSRKPAGSEP